MTSLYDERRKKIKLENHAAKKLLKQNLQEFQWKDLISVGATSLPGLLKGVKDSPSNLIKGGDLVSRTILPRGNFIRRIFRILSILKRSINLLTK